MKTFFGSSEDPQVEEAKATTEFGFFCLKKEMIPKYPSKFTLNSVGERDGPVGGLKDLIVDKNSEFFC
jgi:hypothetical protein